MVAGIIALHQGRIADLDELARRLTQAGTARDRVGAVLRALTPWAATIASNGHSGKSLGRDGAPLPLLEQAPLRMRTADRATDGERA
ncbi:MAG: hypothetical protein WKG00_34080 [Polyangiaceae bacterium]